MKLLALSASGKRSGNINQLCSKILEGAKSAGHETEMINLHDHTIKHCTGCLECIKTHSCVQQDDLQAIMAKQSEADLFVLGAPIYCHNVPGILKDFIDRSCSAVIPCLKLEPNTGLFGKLRIAMAYGKGFETNAPFKTKKIITVLTCSNPGGDFKSADNQLQKYADEMGSKITHKLRCADTLFKLRPKALDRVYHKAFLLGNEL